MNQWNRIKDPEAESTHLWTLNFLQRSQKICNGKKKAASTNGAGITTCRRMQKDPYLSIPMHKTQVQMDQRPQHKSRHTEKVGSSLEHMGTGNHFLNITLAVQILRKTTNK